MRLAVTLLPFMLYLGTSAYAGPPYITDDPEPVDPGHLEIRSFLDTGFDAGEQAGAFGIDANFGLAKNLQLAVATPFEFDSASGQPARFGNVEVGLKYRFYHNEASGLIITVYPRAYFPTSKGGGKTSYLLPVWAQRDFGSWTVFGGAGYSTRPGAGKLNSWQEGIALTRPVAKGLQLGVEAFHEGAESVGGHGATTLGAGALVHISGPFSLELSAGPQLEDGTGHTALHGFASVRAEF